MAALMLQVPEETARVLREIPVPGEPERHEPHVTVIFLGKDVPIDQISAIVPPVYEVASQTMPFSVSTSHVSNFEPGEDGVPVIARIDSPALHRFRDDLCAALDDADFPYDKKFPEYKPHTTLAYAPDPDTVVDLDIPEVTWGAHELVLWGSNRGTGRLVVKFPLSLPVGKTASDHQTAFFRIAVQIAAWRRRDQFV
jgi:2'-5' RNA ligase